MDGQRFDELARRLGSGASRRGVLKGIAAGLGATVFGLAFRQAPQAAAEVGDPCETDGDCGDGEYCVNGTCTYFCLDPGERCPMGTASCCTGSCVNGVCSDDPPQCSGDGGACAAPADCCAGLTCFQATCTSTPPACGEAGDPCSEIACCSGSGLICDNGSCVYPEPTCAAVGEACDFVTADVAGDGSSCCDGAHCVEGSCVPDCTGGGGACQSDDECCYGFFCSDAYTCDPIPVCGDIESACHDDHDCCHGLVCDHWTCQHPKGVCGIPGDHCDIPDHHCCAGLTCFEGLCDNPSGLCMDEWEFCDDKHFLCCKGLVCGHDSFCHPKKHDDKPKPPAPKPQGGPAVTTLPSTGSGDGEDSASWINAAALGGAAAVLGGALLRKTKSSADQQP